MSFNFLGNFRGMTGSEPQNQLMGMLQMPGGMQGQPGAPRFPGASKNLTPRTSAPQLAPPQVAQMPQAPVPGQFGSQGTPQVQNSALMKHLNNPQFTGRIGFGGPGSVESIYASPNRG